MLKLTYGQFTGVIQVMKVVSNQMVLTFCENLPGKQFFTIVLSRQPNIFSAEVKILFHVFSIKKISQHFQKFIRCHRNATILTYNRFLFQFFFIVSRFRILEAYIRYSCIVVCKQCQCEKCVTDQHQCKACR